MSLRSFVALLFVAWLAARARPASAQPATEPSPQPPAETAEAQPGPSAEQERRAQAKALFDQGEAAYRREDFAQALGFYQQAFAAWPLPGFQFNIGQCYRQMGDFAQAIAAYGLYLEESPHAPNRKTVLTLLKQSRRALKQHPPAATPVATPSAPTVAPDMAPAPAEATQPVPEVASPAAAPPAPPAAAAEPVTRPAAPAPASAAKRGTTMVAARGRGHGAWFWTATAGAGVLATVAIVTGAMALSRNHDFKNPATSDSQRLSDKQSGQTLQTVANLSLVGSGLCAAGAVLLWTLGDGRAAPAQVPFQVSTAWVPGGLVIVKQGRF